MVVFVTNYTKACIKGMWYGFPGLNKIKDKKLRWFIKLLLSPIVIFEALRLVFLDRLEIPAFEIVLTTKCSLRCRDCAHLMQYYKAPKHFEETTLEKDMDTLMDKVSAVYVFKFIGGETFLHPQFGKLVAKASASPKIKLIQVFTNATIIPSIEALESLKHSKVVVQISNYGENSRKLKELIDIFTREKIAFEYDENIEWCDTGDVHFRGRNEQELKKLFSSCIASECKSYLNGEFHVCPRSSNGMYLGLIPRNEKEYVKPSDVSGKELKKRIKDLYNIQYISSCNYCDGITSYGKIIKAGIQEKDA
jgi:hypothetical protein